MVLDGLLFKPACPISPENGVLGGILTHRPQDRFAGSGRMRLHKYGDGEFCRFRIPSGLTFTGVYAITVDHELVYIGECENLSRRFNTGYGHISPRNCYAGGRQTNCRVNKLVLEAARSGAQIDLHFFRTPEHKGLETRLFAQLGKPPWNR